MATEQTTEFELNGKPTISGYVVTNAVYGVQEDAEPKNNAAGQFLSKITYGKRSTLSLTLELESDTTSTYQEGGTVASGVVADGAGNATAWKIVSATKTNTRGPTVVEMQLVALTDLLA